MLHLSEPTLLNVYCGESTPIGFKKATQYGESECLERPLISLERPLNIVIKKFWRALTLVLRELLNSDSPIFGEYSI